MTIRKGVLAQQMITLLQQDRTLLEELSASGELPSMDYHPRVRALYQDNAERLSGIIDRQGWPGRDAAGEDGCEAAWHIAMHAVFDVDFMQRCCVALKQAVGDGQAPGWQLAYLEDRMRVLMGEPQRYGTQFEIGEDGWPVPGEIENPADVDRRRQALGLEPLSQRLARLRGSPKGPSWHQERSAGPDRWRDSA
ncbi:hypothetical protein LCL99_00530 [Halomonas denitrificans]|uniref:DUF6624 domain-containing protein n=1 Tax=Halomonas denitrificans TaxID=370769 RepID=UPI001CD781A4|nr:DUF6624 domain-containing protein [Halomonas denitrificans]MCA0972953.1 hypothetical protein [Halomonas denitrificans]